ncbi:MAG TPA: 50S ribosomal protein L1 [Patescibacteria group bacterium]|nr:50S ribosomal protein L1 [Patescibacteria group bacterium]
MGKIRTKTLGLEGVEKKQKESAKIRREQKKIRREKAKETSQENITPSFQETKKEKDETKQTKKPIKEKKNQLIIKGKNYQNAVKQTDKNKKYSLSEALTLIKKIKYATFDETVELHINVKDQNIKGEVTFPNTGFGKKRRVAIIDDTILSAIEKGKIEWDVLIAHPSTMSKLVKYARVLGPKGLMPNPKNGTLTDKTDVAFKKFSANIIHYKTEAKFPIIHQSVGKLSFTDAQLTENIDAFLKAVSTSKINSIFLKSTMSPSVKLQVE